MRNPLTLLQAPKAPTRPGTDIQAAATVAVASRNKLPITATNLFSRSEASRQLDTVSEQGTVYSIVHRIASDVASQDFALQPRQTRHQTEPPPPIVEHTFLDLWERPNDTMTPTGRSFRQLCGMYLELLGEACILVVRAGNKPGGQPVELWPIRPDHLQPVPDPHNWLAGWIHTDVDGVRTPLRPDQIIQLKYPNPMDPYRGLSPLTASMTEVDSANFSSEFQRQFFLNSALPGGIVTTDKHFAPKDFAQWVLRWNEQHQGVANAGRVSLLDAGAKFIAQQMSMVDMQLTALIDANRAGIREAWGVSKTILGGNEDVNRATALAAQQIYGRYTVKDRVDLWLEAGNELARGYRSLTTRRARRPKVEVVITGELTPEDTEIAAKDRDSRVKAFNTYVTQGGDPGETAEAWQLPVVTFAEPEPVPAALLPGAEDVDPDADDPDAVPDGLDGDEADADAGD